ncbi:hypothetical protein F-S17_0220 [Faustovirus]|nr:hypothetical protein F-S17_0220 [Faustovirus]
MTNQCRGAVITNGVKLRCTNLIFDETGVYDDGIKYDHCKHHSEICIPIYIKYKRLTTRALALYDSFDSTIGSNLTMDQISAIFNKAHQIYTNLYAAHKARVDHREIAYMPEFYDYGHDKIIYTLFKRMGKISKLMCKIFDLSLVVSRKITDVVERKDSIKRTLKMSTSRTKIAKNVKKVKQEEINFKKIRREMVYEYINNNSEYVKGVSDFMHELHKDFDCECIDMHLVFAMYLVATCIKCDYPEYTTFYSTKAALHLHYAWEIYCAIGEKFTHVVEHYRNNKQWFTEVFNLIHSMECNIRDIYLEITFTGEKSTITYQYYDIKNGNGKQCGEPGCKSLACSNMIKLGKCPRANILVLSDMRVIGLKRKF